MPAQRIAAAQRVLNSSTMICEVCLFGRRRCSEYSAARPIWLERCPVEASLLGRDTVRTIGPFLQASCQQSGNHRVGQALYATVLQRGTKRLNSSNAAHPSTVLRAGAGASRLVCAQYFCTLL